MNAPEVNNNILSVRELIVLKKREEMLHFVNLDFRESEIHAVIGDHNAGKSLLAGVISGAVKYHGGQIVYRGKVLHNYSPIKARKLGIVTIHQNPTVFPGESVLDNIFLKSLIGNYKGERRQFLEEQARQKLRNFSVSVDLRAPIARCSDSEILVAYIVRSLCASSTILVVDDISGRLSPAQRETLQEELSLLREKGTTIIYFTSNVEEAYHFARTVTFLQDGKVLGTEIASNLGKLELVQLSYSHLYSRKELERNNYELFYLKNYYENIINSMPIPLLLINSQSRIIYINDRFRDNYTLDKDLYIGQDVGELFCSGTPTFKQFQKSLSKADDQLMHFPNIVLAVGHPDESVSLFRIPIFDEEDAFLGFILLFDSMDIHVDIDHYNERIQARKRVPRFAHEIRNPLAILSNFLTLIREKSVSQEMRDYLGRSQTEIKRINSIINNLMKEQHAEDEKTKLVGTIMWAMAEEIRNLVMPITTNSGTTVDNNTARDLQLHYDRDELKEILINLVLNAIEATDSKGNIRIDSDSEIVHGKSYDVLKVQDDGKGITPEERNRIFEPFFSTKTGKERRGLGLTICRDVVEGWGGMITVDSTVGIGTTVSVFLPR